MYSTFLLRFYENSLKIGQNWQEELLINGDASGSFPFH